MVPAEIKRADARQLERLAGDQFLRHREDATGARHRYALRARLTLMLGIGGNDLGALPGAVVPGIVDGHQGDVSGHFGCRVDSGSEEVTLSDCLLARL